MPQSVKPVRLTKAATELNVGLSTIVDFLEKKGIDIEAKPNSKIDGDVYQILLDEFATSKQIKEKSKKTGLPRRENRVTVSLHDSKEEQKSQKKEESEETTLLVDTQDAADEVVKSEAEGENIKLTVKGKIDLDKFKKSKSDKTEDKQPAPEKEKPAEESKAEPVKAEEKPAPKEVEKPAEPKKEEETPVAKTEEGKPAEKVEKKEEPKVEEKPAEEVKAEKPAEEAPKEPEDTVVRARAQKLTGPTVVGKIKLPEDQRSKKKQPVASTSNPETLKGKRKRKRIRKEKLDVNKVSRGPGNNNNNNNAKRGGGKRAGDKKEVNPADINKQIKQTLARLEDRSGNKSARFRRDRRREREETREKEREQAAQEEKTLNITEFVTVSELSNLMHVNVNQVISACMSLGIIASINQRLDAEAISVIAEEFGYEVNFTTAELQESIEVEEDAPEDLETRAPVITVMGHVDHGKTSLLDYVRKENVIAGEAGGITQHIGAYSVELANKRKITFLDTPGHEAFTAMRARGAQVTDLAIIVIAADDNVMPQTREAINHAQAAGIPMIFAINKIDKPGAKPERIKEELANMNILVEDWGGEYQCQEISAKTGQGIAELLDKVLIQSDLMELKGNPEKRALGAVIESSLDRGRGYVATVLVEGGTLRIGDALLAGHYSGKVKAMFNERGTPVEEAGPSIPVSVLGLNGAPNAGDKFNVMEDEREARQIATKREQLVREQGVRAKKHITLDEIGRRIAIGDFKELNVIVKGDVDGSIEALSDSLEKMSTEKIQVNVIHKAVGQITESDIMLASASDAIIVGFQVRPSPSARRLAEQEQIEIKIYSVIYAAIEELKDAMEGMLSPKIEEQIIGNAEVRDTFKITKVGTVAGCFVTDGKILRNAKVRIIRDGIVVYTGDLGSLKRFKEDVKEVQKGYECGLNLEKFNDIKVGDIIEAFQEVEVKQTL